MLCLALTPSVGHVSSPALEAVQQCLHVPGCTVHTFLTRRVSEFIFGRTPKTTEAFRWEQTQRECDVMAFLHKLFTEQIFQNIINVTFNLLPTVCTCTLLVSLSSCVAMFPVNKIHVIIWFPLNRFSQNDFYCRMVLLFLCPVNLACVLGSSEGCYLYRAEPQ